MLIDVLVWGKRAAKLCAPGRDRDHDAGTDVDVNLCRVLVTRRTHPHDFLLHLVPICGAHIGIEVSFVGDARGPEKDHNADADFFGFVDLMDNKYGALVVLAYQPDEFGAQAAGGSLVQRGEQFVAG